MEDERLVLKKIIIFNNLNINLKKLTFGFSKISVLGVIQNQKMSRVRHFHKKSALHGSGSIQHPTIPIHLVQTEWKNFVKTLP